MNLHEAKIQKSVIPANGGGGGGRPVFGAGTAAIHLSDRRWGRTAIPYQ